MTFSASVPFALMVSSSGSVRMSLLLRNQAHQHESRSKARIHDSWDIVNKLIEHVGDYNAGIDREVCLPSLYNNTDINVTSIIR